MLFQFFFSPPVLFFFFFLSLGFGSYRVLTSSISLNSIIQIFATLILLIVILEKIGFPKIKQFSKKLVLFFALLPITLFIYLLVLSTGGLASPFLILTHFFSIGLAFLISPQISVSYTVATMATFIYTLAFNQTAKEFLSQSPLAVILYFTAYIAIIPLSYILAKEYKFREEWGRILEKEIATSKEQEEKLLMNINDAVFVLNANFNLVYLNQAAMKLTGHNIEILGKNYFNIFSFKDKDGRNLEPFQLPLEQTLTSKTQSIVEDIQIMTKEKIFLHIDLKVLPAIGAEGPLGVILVVEDRSKKDIESKHKKTSSLLGLARFLSFLNSQKIQLQQLGRGNFTQNQIGSLVKQNRELEHLATDFIYTLIMESGEIGGLSSLVDIGDLIQEVIFEQKQLAQEYGVTLTHKTRIAEASPVAPKSTLKIPIEKGIFPKTNIVGNITWIKDSMYRILEIIFRLSQKGDNIEINVIRSEGLAAICINTKIAKIPPESAFELFEKFYGKLQDLPQLSESSGFEGFIAKSLIERMGGNINVSKDGSGSLIFTITFGEKEISSTIG